MAFRDPQGLGLQCLFAIDFTRAMIVMHGSLRQNLKVGPVHECLSLSQLSFSTGATGSSRCHCIAGYLIWSLVCV